MLLKCIVALTANVVKHKNKKTLKKSKKEVKISNKKSKK